MPATIAAPAMRRPLGRAISRPTNSPSAATATQPITNGVSQGSQALRPSSTTAQAAVAAKETGSSQDVHQLRRYPSHKATRPEPHRAAIEGAIAEV
jgi:hypothetical protein